MSDDPIVSRLVMVDVTWVYCRFPLWEAQQDEVGAKYGSLVRGLLTFDKGVSCDRDSWILHDPTETALRQLEKKSVDQIDNDAILAPYRWFRTVREREPEVDPSTRVPGPAGRWWRFGPGAASAVDRIEEGMKRCGSVATHAWMEHEEGLLAMQMNLFACRIYLSPEGVARLMGWADPSPGRIPLHACIDLRFNNHFEESFTDRLVRYWLYATLSVWTYKPASVFHAPEPLPSSGAEPPIEWSDAFSTLHDVRKEFGKLISKQFTRTKLEILHREYVPPRFWFARGPKIPKAPSSIGKIDSDNFNALTGKLLKVPDVRCAGVATSVINGRLLLVRRLLPPSPGETEATPCYIVIPLGEGPEIREDDARELVWELTDLEGSVAAKLFDAMTSLNIYDNHIQVYNLVVNRADVLWDQLALHLPVARVGKGRRINRLIQLIHQTLLQGIADLDQVTIEATEVGRKVESAKNELGDDFDQFAERAVERPARSSDETPILSSLTKTGGFETALREVKRVRDDAERVQRSYHTLLDGMGRAFDEQRVRGIDVLQRVGFIFATVLALTPWAPEAMNAVFASWREKSPLPPGELLGFPLGWLVAVLGLVGMASLIILWIWQFFLRRKSATLGTRRFRRRHKKLRKFLASCATDRLTRLRDDSWRDVREALNTGKSDEDAWKDYFKKWKKIDQRLARKCAKLVDKFDRYKAPKRTWNNRLSEVGDLVKKVERWALTALLVSERPRQFRLFAIPRLTFVYRLYSPMIDALRLNSLNASGADIVSISDFDFTIDNQCNGDHQRRDQIEEWARWQIGKRPSAVHLVKQLHRVGLKAGMTHADFEEMLKKIIQELIRAPGPVRAHDELD